MSLLMQMLSAWLAMACAIHMVAACHAAGEARFWREDDLPRHHEWNRRAFRAALDRDHCWAIAAFSLAGCLWSAAVTVTP